MTEKKLKTKSSALFFTLGVSLRKWDDVGLIDREIKPYNQMAKFFKKIYFITYGGKEDLKYRNVLANNIVILPKKINLPNKIYSLLIPFLYWQELRHIDILKTNQMRGVWAALLTKFVHRKKLVVRCGYQWSLHVKGWHAGRIKRFIVYLIELLAYKKADAIIVTSNQAKEYVQKRYHIASKKVNLISNYIDTNLFKRFKTLKTPKSICFVGRLEEQKNLFSLFRALKSLDLKLIIFGKGSLRDKLKNFAKKNQLNVKFRGNISNNQLPKELNRCGIFILPSLYEGNPKTLLEAMACELPVVGTNVRGINNIVRHKENGYLCDVSADSIKQAIKEIMGDRTLGGKIGKNAREYILKNCSLEKIIEKEIKIYEE